MLRALCYKNKFLHKINFPSLLTILHTWYHLIIFLSPKRSHTNTLHVNAYTLILEYLYKDMPLLIDQKTAYNCLFLLMTKYFVKTFIYTELMLPLTCHAEKLSVHSINSSNKSSNVPIFHTWISSHLYFCSSQGHQMFPTGIPNLPYSDNRERLYIHK